MKEIFTAKSIEEAKHLAAEKFGVSEDQIVYRILEEPKKGLFGKIKREAQVEAVYEEPAAAAAAAVRERQRLLRRRPRQKRRQHQFPSPYWRQFLL